MRVVSVPADQPDPPVAEWLPELKQAGRYHVMAWIPFIENQTPDSTAARYVIHHAGAATTVTIDQSAAVNTWADLGIYQFDSNQHPYVELPAVDAQPGTNVWFDVMVWLPVK